MKTRLFTALLMSACMVSSQAFADRDWRDDRGRHNGWDNHWRYDGHRDSPRYTIYRTPRPRVDYVYLSNRPASYSQVRCTNSVNPLGLLLGGAAGGIVGHQIGKGKGNTAATIGGVLLGSAIAGSYSERCSEEVFQHVPVGTPISWQGTNEYYQVTPTRDYRTEGRYCREYQARATVGGRVQDTYGTACMQPDGSWEVVN